ncbi:hypothetical protein EHS14_04365 [Schaalia georgiae]|nr:hypothetical protein EHS14_04365 [Schaalia georgiae]
MLEIFLYFGFFIVYVVKLLIIFFYMWLLDIYGEVYYSMCMFLVGILLKMGVYGLICINMELLFYVYYLFLFWFGTASRKFRCEAACRRVKI